MSQLNKVNIYNKVPLKKYLWSNLTSQSQGSGGEIGPTGSSGYNGVTGSTGAAGTIDRNTYMINMDNDAVKQLQQFNFYNDVFIKDSDIVSDLNGFSKSSNQEFSFGQHIQNRWVAVGSGFTGSVAFSDDGKNWNSLGLNVFNNSGYGVFWNGSMWIAVGNDSRYSIAYSHDGISWSGVTGSKSLIVIGYDVVYGGSVWVAVGTNPNTAVGTDPNTIAYSYDGIYWNKADFVAGFTNGGLCVSWNGQMFVAGGSGYNNAAYSIDGIEWSSSNSANPIFNSINCVEWNGSMWLIGGQSNEGYKNIAYSFNGIDWSESNNTVINIIHSITWNGTYWIATGNDHNNGISYDGLNWTLFDDAIFTPFAIFPPSPIPYYDIEYNGSIYLLASGGSSDSLSWSNDGHHWIGLGNSIFSTAHKICYNGKRENTINYSKDMMILGGTGSSGSIYYMYNQGNNRPNNESTVFESYDSEEILTEPYTSAFNGNMWVIGGTGPISTMAYSYDGNIWYNSNSIVTIIDICVKSVIWDGFKFIACGISTDPNPTIAYSYDGITWTGVENSWSLIPQCNKVAYNGTNYLLGGTGSYRLLSSNDGILWNIIDNSNINIPSNVYSIAWNGIYWVIGGTLSNNGTGTNNMAYSSDTIIWNPISNPIFDICKDILWNGSIFVACGIPISDQNFIGYSYDGITWSSVTLQDPDSNQVSMLGNTVYWTGSYWGIGCDVLIINLNKYNSAISSDGINWIPVLFPFFDNIYSVMSNKSIPKINIKHPIIVGGDGTADTMAYSYDAINWTGLGKDIFTISCNGASWNGSIWVAVGSGVNRIAYSYNGIYWIGSSSGNAIITESANGVCWNGQLWVVVGNQYIISSIDGINWTQREYISNIKYNCIAWNGKCFAVGGQLYDVDYGVLYWSNNGIDWSSYDSVIDDHDPENPLNLEGFICKDVKWFEIFFFAVGGGQIFISQDGSNWLRTLNETDNIITGIAGTYDLIVITGYRRILNPAKNIRYSIREGPWTNIDTELVPFIGSSIGWDGTRYIATSSVGTNKIIYSYDAINWYSSVNGNEIFTSCNNVSAMSNLAQVKINKQIVIPKNKTLDCISNSYNSDGFNNAVISIKATHFS